MADEDAAPRAQDALYLDQAFDGDRPEVKCFKGGYQVKTVVRKREVADVGLQYPAATFGDGCGVGLFGDADAGSGVVDAGGGARRAKAQQSCQVHAPAATDVKRVGSGKRMHVREPPGGQVGMTLIHAPQNGFAVAADGFGCVLDEGVDVHMRGGIVAAAPLAVKGGRCSFELGTAVCLSI